MSDNDMIRRGDALAIAQSCPDSHWGPWIAERLAALPAVTVRVKWRNIETAPRGGEWFIARTEHGTTRVVRYADEYDRFPISHDGVVWPTAPTEWTPLKPVLAALEPVAAPDPALRPTMTDMMVDPDTLDDFMDANPLPDTPDHAAIREAAQVERMQNLIDAYEDIMDYGIVFAKREQQDRLKAAKEKLE